jgi:hypothetical protein
MAAILLSMVLAYAQNNETQYNSLSVFTYYPPPDASFKNIEVRTGIAVGNISESNLTNLSDMSQLKPGQIYVGNRTRFNDHISSPANITHPWPGQIIYVNNTTTHNLMFYNGTWVKIGG